MPRTKGLSIIIPAAGIGRRMKSHGPKPLMGLANQQTIISRQLELIKQHYPDAEVIVVVGFEAEEMLKNLPSYVRVVENERYEETNVTRSLGMGLRVMNSSNNLLVIYGDLVFNANAIKRVVGQDSVVVVDNRKQFDDDEVGVTVADGRITQFNYGLATKWAQIAYLTSVELDLFKKIAASPESKKWFGFETLNKVINMGGKLRVMEPNRMKIVEVDTTQNLEKARLIQ
jgi:choline kinase